ncbi:hypothetical protein G7B40_018265 [Aetokthonos hydrillicola Thurmond2011]|jgi:hypothetical protein|uniref:Uncharacterized protein n=1 Tax=Aetokthonos hydrillicola Thurmond2011 TaxID=2712845 RepID=A0AAP5ICH1_9CYAN|nr:hypothetical protein [Aetokthonos hydrillicola]MBO3460354.1 hypothetical protein [Aetokthonos hydrillicola CCALA 1050]MBW4588380.1 hypothetical protein [Aetokthonos hydrillicola CCALA 1050]MDR9896490.1 hypothetical protein [Aetokthonos hydrillicola Thurmond2011]
MQSVTLNYHVGDDGILHLDVPVGLQNADVEVTVTVQPANRTMEEEVLQGKGWPPGFFEETFGSCKDDPIVIDSNGVFDDSEELA